MPKKTSKTNDTTRQILEFLRTQGVFAWRQNVMGIPIRRAGVITGYRSAGKSGVPDVCAICPPSGRYLGVEIKTGRDTLRDEQIGFHRSARGCGALVMVVSDFEDFRRQWEELTQENNLKNVGFTC